MNFTMTRTDLILLVLVRLCIPIVCWAANCDLLQDKECEKWKIENGHGCSKWEGYSAKYTLVVTCKRNFHLMHYPNQTCIVFQIDRLEYDFNSRFKCIEDNTSTKSITVITEATSESVPVTSDLTSTMATAIITTVAAAATTTTITTATTTTAITITTATVRKISMHFVTRETEGGPVMYITIAAVGMVLILICIIVGICWKRSRADSGVYLHQMCNPFVSTSNTFDTAKTETGENTSHLTVADHNDFNYAVAMDLEGGAENFDDNEYNILHVNEQNKPAVQTNTSYDDKDLYSHTPRDICHAHSDSETYSHLTSDGLGLGCSARKNATDNIYNKLSVDSSERNIKDSARPDPDYDHTFIHRDESASIENDTYAHVNDNLV